MSNKPVYKIIILLLPGMAVLLLMVFVALVSGEFTFLSGSEALGKIFIRFIRLAVTVLIPLAFLPLTCSLSSIYFNRGPRRLDVISMADNHIKRTHIMLTRPFQAIAVAMIFATKLISLLQIYSGHADDPVSILHMSQFSLLRFIAATVIGMLTSFVLITFWSLDDLHIRSRNIKTMEIERPGKAVGTVIPVFFGFYGITQLFSSYPLNSAIYYTAQIVFVLYTPFLLLSIAHLIYISKNRDFLLKRLGAVFNKFGSYTDDKDLK